MVVGPPSVYGVIFIPPLERGGSPFRQCTWVDTTRCHTQTPCLFLKKTVLGFFLRHRAAREKIAGTARRQRQGLPPSRVGSLRTFPARASGNQLLDTARKKGRPLEHSRAGTRRSFRRPPGFKRTAGPHFLPIEDRPAMGKVPDGPQYFSFLVENIGKNKGSRGGYLPALGPTEGPT